MRPTTSSTCPGARDFAALRAPGPHYVLREYVDPFGSALAAADLVVARAGGSVFELAQYGLPAVLVPYPHASADHQTANARWMAEAGAATILRDDELTRSACAPRSTGCSPTRTACARWPPRRARSPARTPPRSSRGRCSRPPASVAAVGRRHGALSARRILTPIQGVGPSMPLRGPDAFRAHHASSARPAGFTLIELLVVILIIGDPRGDRAARFPEPAHEGPGRRGQVRGPQRPHDARDLPHGPLDLRHRRGGADRPRARAGRREEPDHRPAPTRPSPSRSTRRPPAAAAPSPSSSPGGTVMR